ncbi:hypothetical protein MHEI_25270 [Mycobacterium heidelbergense]|nr:hypothetical protein MHEI_25270 [Mycobacterium heidelbergense]
MTIDVRMIHAPAGLGELGLSDGGRRDFLRGNAERVFGLEGIT